MSLHPFLQNLFLKFFPRTFFCLESKKHGVDKRLEACKKLFDGSQRIDFFSLNDTQRGFMIVIDTKFSLWFYQDGDHFIFDGWEMGEYNNGEVVVLDSCRNQTSPFK